jgi:hypothetical protein
LFGVVVVVEVEVEVEVVVEVVVVVEVEVGVVVGVVVEVVVEVVVVVGVEVEVVVGVEVEVEVTLLTERNGGCMTVKALIEMLQKEKPESLVFFNKNMYNAIPKEIVRKYTDGNNEGYVYSCADGADNCILIN